MELENQLKLLNAKLGVLKLVQKSSTKVIKDGHPIEVEQTSSLVEGKLKEIYKLKEEIAEQKLIAGEDFDEVEWCTTLKSEWILRNFVEKRSGPLNNGQAWVG